MEVIWVQALGLEGLARPACGHWVRHRLVLQFFGYIRVLTEGLNLKIAIPSGCPGP